MWGGVKTTVLIFFCEKQEEELGGGVVRSRRSRRKACPEYPPGFCSKNRFSSNIFAGMKNDCKVVFRAATAILV
jgi:hypothetical protein